MKKLFLLFLLCFIIAAPAQASTAEVLESYSQSYKLFLNLRHDSALETTIRNQRKDQRCAGAIATNLTKDQKIWAIRLFVFSYTDFLSTVLSKRKELILKEIKRLNSDSVKIAGRAKTTADKKIALSLGDHANLIRAYLWAPTANFCSILKDGLPLNQELRYFLAREKWFTALHRRQDVYSQKIAEAQLLMQPSGQSYGELLPSLIG